jgi:ankyrin repeat protein
MAEPPPLVPPVVRPRMSNAMERATSNGDTPAIVRLVAEGESVNCVDVEGTTPVLRVLFLNHGLEVLNALIDTGADLSIATYDGSNVVHAAACGGNVECIDRVLAITTFDINSTNEDGISPLTNALFRGHYEASLRLVEMGVNLFANHSNGRRTIEFYVPDGRLLLGPRVLHHFKNIKWQSVKPLLLLYASYASPILFNDGRAQVQSAHLASRVLASPDLIRVIASYFIPLKITTRDKSIKAPDAVRERVEAELGFT